MGFWQGLNAGIKGVQEERTRKEERQQEIDLRKAEIEEQRKYDRETFMLQTAESRRDSLLTLYVKKEQEKAEAEALTGKAQSFLGRLGDIEDPRVAALARDPRTAAELEDKIQGIEIKAAEAGVELPPLQGEALLELLTVYDSGSESVSSVDVTFDDLLSGDFSDVGTYYETAAGLSIPTPRVTATLNPEAYRRYDPETLEEGRKAFDQEVLRLANESLGATGDTGENADLRALIEGYSKENSAERFALMDMFGQQAFAGLAESGNPYIQNLEQDPQLSRYSAMARLNLILADPEATEEERAMAQELLTRLQ
jgi:hypothetical protein